MSDKPKISGFLDEGDLVLYPRCAEEGNARVVIYRDSFLFLARALLAELADDDVYAEDEFDLDGNFGFLTDEDGGGVKGCEACGGTGKVSDGS